MSVWVTRSAPGNLSTARGLKTLGRKPLLVPVLATRGLPHDELGSLPDALVFSSVHAVRHHRFSERFHDVPVFTASGAAAAAAAAAGYRSVTSAGGTDETLGGMLGHVLRRRARVALLCAARTGNMLEERLGPTEVQLERLVVYEPVGLDDREIDPAIEQLGRVDAITVHSRTAAERLLPAIRHSDWRGSFWCMSHEAGALLSSVPGVAVAVAEGPTENALLAMIARRTPFGSPTGLRARPPLPLRAERASFCRSAEQDPAANDNARE